MLHGAAIVKMGFEHGQPHHHGEDHHEGPGHHLGHGSAPSPLVDGLRRIPFLGPLLAGVVLYFKALWPHIEVPYVGWFFSLAIFSIELVSTVIKSGVLA